MKATSEIIRKEREICRKWHIPFRFEKIGGEYVLFVPYTQYLLLREMGYINIAIL